MTAPDSLLAGRYRRVRPLGRGAMGEVWLATDELLHRTVAIKSVHAGADPDLLERIVREARLAAGLNHPNAVAVHDLVRTDSDHPYVVMEYVAGRSLADELRDHGPLDPARVREIGAAVAAALAAAHARGIVHRDVKPANVLLADDGSVKLADFGIARSVSTTTTGLVLGTPAFVPPEVVRGEPADARGDVWSLGITLYAALEGRSPFQRADDDSVYAVLNRVATEPVPPPRDPLTGPVVMRLLHVDPAERPTAAQAVTQLRATGNPELATVPSGAPGRARAGRSRTRVAIVAAVVVAVVALIAAAVIGVVTLSGGDGDRTASPGTQRADTPSRSASSPASTYTAPGGISVRAPAGWLADDSAGIANVRDYRAPGTTDRSSGAYFRIGIANTDPADTIDAEARGTERYLLAANGGAKLVSSGTSTFLGSPAVTQEYTRTNPAGVARHLLLRLWFHAGRTLEIELDAPEAGFAQRRAIFDGLTATCRVT